MLKQKKMVNISDQLIVTPPNKITKPLFRSPKQGGILSPQRLRVKPMIYKRCQVNIKEAFQAPLSPKLMKYVFYVEVNDETLSIGIDENRLQGPMKKFASYMRKFRKAKGMVVNTQQMWYESDYAMVSGAFTLFAKNFDGSAMRKLSLTFNFEEDYSFAFTEIRWLYVVISFLVKMKNLKKLKIDFCNIYYGYGPYSEKALRLRLLKRLKFLEKLEALRIMSGSGQLKKKEFELVCKKLPNVKNLNLDDFEEDDEDWDSEDEEDEGNEDENNEGTEGEEGGEGGNDEIRHNIFKV